MSHPLTSRWYELAETFGRFGADGIAAAIKQCARELEEWIDRQGDELLTVEEAHRLTGASCETIRRAVRAGSIVDLRTNPRGKMRIRKCDLRFLEGKARSASRHADALASSAVAALARL